MVARSALAVALTCSTVPATIAATWSASCGSPLAEAVMDMALLPGGDLAVVGRVSVTGGSGESGDVLVMRFGPGGELRWARTYGGSLDDGGLGVAARTDGSLVVAAFTESFGVPGSNLWLLMLSAAGDVTWERTLGERAGGDFGDICALADDRVVLVSRTEGPGGLRLSDGWIVTVDSAGRIVQSTWGGDLEEGFSRVAALPAGGIIVAGFLPPQEDVLVRLDAAGDVVWGASLLPSWSLRSIEAVVGSADGGALVLAENAWGQGSEIVIAKVTADGVVAWARRTASSTVGPIGIAEMPDGRIAWAATIESADGDEDVLLVEMDSAGALLRQVVVGGGGVDGGASAVGRFGGALRLLDGTDLVVAGTTQPTAASLPDAWITRVPADWSEAACFKPDAPGIWLLPLDLEAEPRPRERARPSAQPSRTAALVADWAVTMGDPCIAAPCGSVVPREVSGPRWENPLLVRDEGRLTWEEARQSCESYVIRRGLVATLLSGNRGACLVTGLSVTEYVDAELPGVGAAWFYLVTMVSAAGEGSLGTDSQGRPRAAGTPCR